MRYESAIRYFYGLGVRGVRPGLDRIERAMDARGHPDRSMCVVHVAGTNGKGSVSAMVASALRGAGFRVGLFTSPHLHRYTERFMVDGAPVSRASLAAAVSDIREWLQGGTAPALTFFEASTLLAFELFRSQGCQVAVIEVGMGGRLDSTNIVQPRVTAITSISKDHTARLGKALVGIAREKAGIIKPGVPVIVGRVPPAAGRVIAQRAREQDAALLRVGREIRCSGSETALRVDVLGQRWDDLRSPLQGLHQLGNLTCAVGVLAALQNTGLGFDMRAGLRGLMQTRWPGRLEQLPGAPGLLLDVAHNQAGCAALAAHLRRHDHAGSTVLIFGCLADKDHGAMLSEFEGIVQDVVFVTPPTDRALEARRLVEVHGGKRSHCARTALSRAERMAGKRGLVVVAGSIFLLAEIRALRLGLRADPPIPM